MKSIVLILLLTIFISAKSINIAVAANVSYAIEDLIKSFKKSHSDIDVQTTVGSSGKLTAQIRAGAPYSILISANMAYPKALFKEGLTKDKPKVYAKGSLALLTTRGFDIESGLKSLTNPKIEKIAIANDKTAPYGVAAKEALENAKLYNRLKAKFIYGESVGQTLLYTLNAADAGLVAKSLLYSPKMAKYKEGRDWISVDKSLYTPIEQGAVLIKGASSDANEFYNFLFSKEAKKILKAFGYGV